MYDFIFVILFICLFVCLFVLMLNTGVEFLGEFSSLVDPRKKVGRGLLTHAKVIIV